MPLVECKKLKTTRRLLDLAAELMTINDKTNALKLYNRSIACTPTNVVDLPIVYANKSAVLLEMKNYDFCLQNINLALKHGMCPGWLISSLLERKVKCLLLMGKWNDHNEKKLFRTIKRLAISSQEKSILRTKLNQYLIDTYNIIKNTEEAKFKAVLSNAKNYKTEKKKHYPIDNNLLHLDNRIQMMENATYGRHIVAKEDIDMGELLIQEKAIVTNLYQCEVYDYCSCCLIRTQVLIPCDNCSTVLFCSNQCQINASAKFHRVECLLGNYLTSLLPEEQHIQYIFRLLCLLSNQGEKLNELVEKWNELKNSQRNCPPSTSEFQMPQDFWSLFMTFDKFKYEPVQYAHSQIRYTKLVEVLKTQTNFFSFAENTVYEHYFEFMVVDLLIDLEAFFKCNSFCVSDCIRSNDEMSITRKNIGLACYRETNFLNHSCVPNVAYWFENGNTISTFSLRKIKAGEQLFICYLNTYYEAEKSKRDLMKNYSFQCSCVACRENWPVFHHLQSVYDIRFCECLHTNALSRRISITGCSFCRFKRDLAISVKTVRDRLNSEMPFENVIENLRLDIVEAVELFQSLDGIEVNLIKEYVELYSLYSRCIEIAGNQKYE